MIRPTAEELLTMLERLQDRNDDLGKCLVEIFETGVRFAKTGYAEPVSQRVSWHREAIAKFAAPVLEAVSRHYRVSVRELTGLSHVRLIAWPRFVAMWLLRLGDADRDGMSFPEIGIAVNRDHSSVISGFRRVERRRAEDPKLAADLDALRDSLRANRERVAA